MKNKWELLKQHVEKTFGRSVTTSRHFDLLRESIRARTGVLFCATTLKRHWGYLDEDVVPRLHTLDTLSRYAGWKDWESFLSSGDAGIQSGLVGSSCIDVIADLQPGDTLLLTWLPDRECTTRYKGDGWFEIVAASNTRLQAGDTFQCLHVIDSEPLYLDHLTRDGIGLGVYVCGRETGVRFRINEYR